MVEEDKKQRDFEHFRKKTTEPPAESAEKANEDSNWQKDIEKRDYYYDDSHGYEIYNPEDDDEKE